MIDQLMQQFKVDARSNIYIGLGETVFEYL